MAFIKNVGTTAWYTVGVFCFLVFIMFASFWYMTPPTNTAISNGYKNLTMFSLYFIIPLGLICFAIGYILVIGKKRSSQNLRTASYKKSQED